MARGDLRDIATDKGQLGTVRLLQRRYPEALAAWDEARRTFEQLGEPGTVATAWHQIGVVHQEAGQYDRAEHAYQQSLHTKVSCGDRAGEANSLDNLGSVYSQQGRREEAVRFYRQAADIYSAPDIQDLAGEGRARSNAGGQLMQLNRHNDARTELQRAIKCLEPFGHAAQLWKVLTVLGNLERAVGDLPASAAARDRAIAAYLAYRRDSGEPMAQAAAMIAAVAGDRSDLIGQIEQLLPRPDVPESVRAACTALHEILTGSRDPALAADPRLDYDDSAELLLLLERLAAS